MDQQYLLIGILSNLVGIVLLVRMLRIESRTSNSQAPKANNWLLLCGVLAVSLGVSLCIAPLVIRLSGANTTTKHPFDTLIANATEGQLPSVQELRRRSVTGSLTPDQLAELAEAAVTQHAIMHGKIERHEMLDNIESRQAWTDLLAKLDESGSLSYEQKTEYYKNLAVLNVLHRPRIRAGDPIPVDLAFYSCVPSDDVAQYHLNLMEPTLHSQTDRVDCESVESGFIMGLSPFFNGIFNKPLMLDCVSLPAGKHRFELRFRRYLESTGGDDWVTLDESDVQWPLDIEVLPADSPIPVKMTKDDKYREVLGKRLTATSVTWQQREQGGHLYIWLEFKGPSQIPIAFDVTATLADRKIDLGGIMCSAQSADHTATWSLDTPLDQLESHQITLTLKANAELALETTDIFEIWDGQLEIGPLTVRKN